SRVVYGSEIRTMDSRQRWCEFLIHDTRRYSMHGPFRASLKPLFCAALLALTCGEPAVAQQSAQELIVNLSVTADPVKANGSPWDGYPAVGRRVVVPETSNAPDITVCVVRMAAAPECVWRTERRKRLSHCPDAETCTIPGMRLPVLPVGLIFLDVDLIRHDLIDFVILTGDKIEPGDVEKIEASLRVAMMSLTPGGTPRDRQRRQRKARVLPISLCMGENAKCDLSQSRFWLEKR
ncbi:hypothetical protein, partial [Bradyrhizobium sp. LHD-71]|uniref:hypothetical protein n=1 Tax=Bradyrhizobium sp. LHD-71 TaxID=3072141 RepID=UPI00280C8DE1